MLESLKKQVCEANLLLPRYHLVKFTWGNVSGLNPDRTLVVIKPSGVPYEQLEPESMVVVSMDGHVVEGDLRPSSDTPTHLALYHSFPSIYGITHTHSEWATAWAQACRAIPCFGTTHADFAYGEIPCVRPLSKTEVSENYERNTGEVLANYFQEHDIDFHAVPGALCAFHGDFTWGCSPVESVENAAVLEEIAKIAGHTVNLGQQLPQIPQWYADKHYFRKHGDKAYYGQK